MKNNPMQDNKVIPINEKYRYNIFINTKAIWDFLGKYNTRHIIVNTTQIHILSFLVEMMNAKDVKYITDETGNKFVYAMDKFILGNLKFLGIKSRRLKDFIQQLEMAKTIERRTINENQRFIRVHPELIELWYTENWTMTATVYMEKYRPKLWESFKNEWITILGRPEFKNAIDWCNNEIDIQQIKYNNFDEVYKLMTNTLKSWQAGKYKSG
ncbi:hypothetical protein V5097_02150 [Arenibacter palladensis]|uniref:hypothetical protein n=1 Tax=Arenibacter palladensis TaxID=237373 RepID=UPI002FD1FBD2